MTEEKEISDLLTELQDGFRTLSDNFIVRTSGHLVRRAEVQQTLDILSNKKDVEVLDFFANTLYTDETVKLHYVNNFLNDIINGVNFDEIRGEFSYIGSEYDNYDNKFKIVKGSPSSDYQTPVLTFFA